VSSLGIREPFEGDDIPDPSDLRAAATVCGMVTDAPDSAFGAAGRYVD
jgi:hypothetical protein